MILLWLAAALAPVRLPPVDQCQGDPAFDRFRAALTAAVADRDGDAVVRLASDDVRLSFGGRGGKSMLRSMLAAGGSDAERLWKAFGESLALGCASKGEVRIFPSMFVQGDGFDGFTTWIARPRARLRSAPRVSASVKAHLSWDVLTDDETMDGGPWIRVRTAKGRRGYIHRSAARNLNDYRLLAERRAGEWRMTAFVAGD